MIMGIIKDVDDDDVYTRRPDGKSNMQITKQRPADINM